MHLIRDPVATKSVCRPTAGTKVKADLVKTIPDSGASKSDFGKIAQNVHNISHRVHETNQVQRSAGSTVSGECTLYHVPSVGKVPARSGPASLGSVTNKSEFSRTNSQKSESDKVKIASYHIGKVSHSVKPVILPMKTVSHPKGNTSLPVRSVSHPVTAAHPIKASTSPLFHPLTTVVRSGKSSIPFHVVPNPVQCISFVTVVGFQSMLTCFSCYCILRGWVFVFRLYK